MTDHVEAARHALKNSDQFNDKGAADAIAEAQVHATLAVAEQLRIANLIAAFCESNLTDFPANLGFTDTSAIVDHVRKAVNPE